MFDLTSFTRCAFTACAFTVMTQTGAFGAPPETMFFDAALCKPPYTMMSATEVYDAAEKIAKPDTSAMGAAIYNIPQGIGRDGFESSEVFFANSIVGVLIQGLRADDLAEKYHLKQDTSNLWGTASKAYARELAKDLQPEPGLAGPGKVSIVAREGKAFSGKTLLACEFVPD